MGFRIQMSRRSPSSLPLVLFFLLAIIFLGKSVGVVSAFKYPNGKQPSSSTLRRIHKYLATINKPAVLSIDSPDGDIIDCVDRLKQLSFDHPLLKNHTLQVVPPKFPSEEKYFAKKKNTNGVKDKSRVAPMQVWHLNGTRCPKGTVPFRRTTVKDVLWAKSLSNFIRKQRKTAGGPFHNNITFSPDDNVPIRHEYAAVAAHSSRPRYGAGAVLNRWEPTIGHPEEMSIAQIWVVKSPANRAQYTSIEAGWHVYPQINGGDDQTRLFTYWTNDNYGQTGCYYNRCKGFIQISDQITVGAALNPVSVVNGEQRESIIRIAHDAATGNWWLSYGDSDVGPPMIQVGYWPPEVVPVLRDGSGGAEFGGEITNKGHNGQHTYTQMGSGRFAHDEFSRAAYFREMYLFDEYHNLIQPEFTDSLTTDANCYNMYGLGSTPVNMGLHFYFGGPGGGNPDCHN